jgi:uncharacterized protein YjbI with pentapeptide repeats
MSSQLVAAIIAACISGLTLIGTVVTQIIGFHSTKTNTEEQIQATQKNTADTLEQQREQLKQTLEQQREQLKQTLDEQRARTLNERFATAAEQLGSDKPPAVRLAGVYAMAGLADDWKEHRQTCVDVLCAYLRMPYEPDPGKHAPAPKRLAFRASREVRHTVIRVITAHLKDDAAVSWQGLNLDFTGVAFDGGDFSRAEFSDGTVSFRGAVFSGGTVDLGYAAFTDGRVDFGGARFSDGTVGFRGAKFSGGTVGFRGAAFTGGTADFSYAEFTSGTVSFRSAEFSGGTVSFSSAAFSRGTADFTHAEFSGGTVYFRRAALSSGAVFSGGTADFTHAVFSGGTVDFGVGGRVGFSRAEFSGGTVDFSGAADWSFPPAFPWADTPPPGVKLPGKEDQSQARGSED